MRSLKQIKFSNSKNNSFEKYYLILSLANIALFKLKSNRTNGVFIVLSQSGISKLTTSPFKVNFGAQRGI